MLLHLSTWPEVENYLNHSQGIIIPIGSTEQHGPTGLIGTDAICAEAIAQGVGDKIGALVAPTFNVGMALHHGAFPGTISLRPSTLIQVIQDWVLSLVRAGFRRFFFINGHGGNVASLKAAFAETYSHLCDLGIPGAEAVQCEIMNWYMLRGVYTLARELYGEAEGSHATPSEVALTQYVYPDSIKTAPLDPLKPAPRGVYSAPDFRRRYPDGRMGSNPALATPEHGQRFYQIAVEEMVTAYQAFLETPLP